MNNANKEKDKVRRSIDPDMDFTCSQLAKFLNEIFGTKKTGNKFTNQDVYNYSKRGSLPDEYGGFDIERVNVPSVGVTVMRIRDVEKLKQMKKIEA